MSTFKHVDIVIYDAPAARSSGCGCGCDHHHGGGQPGHHHHRHDYHHHHGSGHDHSHCHSHGDDCAPDHCLSHGGADRLSSVSTAMQARALALTLEQAFPGKVRVEYINVLQDPRGPSLPQTALICSLAYPPPLVYIDGQGRFAGAIPVERIRDEVSKILGEPPSRRLRLVQ